MTRRPSVLRLSVVGALIVCMAGCSRSVEVVFDVPNGVSAVSVDGGRVFLAGTYRQPDLRVVSFPSEQAGPQETVATGVFGPPRPGSGVGALEVRGSTAFAALSSGLLVLDVPDVASPLVLSTPDPNATPGPSRALAVADGLAVVTTHSLGTPRNRHLSTGLSLIDVRDPSAPRPISAITLPRGSDGVAGIALRGPMLLVAARQSGLFIYDVTDPSSPGLLSQYRPGHWTRGGRERRRRGLPVCIDDQGCVVGACAGHPGSVGTQAHRVSRDSRGCSAAGCVLSLSLRRRPAGGAANLRHHDACWASACFAFPVPRQRDGRRCVGCPRGDLGQWRAGADSPTLEVSGPAVGPQPASAPDGLLQPLVTGTFRPCNLRAPPDWL